MKAPDKIYVWEHNIEAGTITDLGELCVQGSIEYIRKDALLAWARKKNKRIDTDEGDYSLGYVSAMIDLINKLNSM